MFELFLIIYLLAVLVSSSLAIKYSGLLAKSPDAQLEEKRKLVEEAMRILNSMSCIFCGSRDTYVERIDLFQSNVAITNCNQCHQKAMWKLENYVWRLTAPYRYLVPSVPTIPASATIELKGEEEINLEFAN